MRLLAFQLRQLFSCLLQFLIEMINLLVVRLRTPLRLRILCLEILDLFLQYSNLVCHFKFLPLQLPWPGVLLRNMTLDIFYGAIEPGNHAFFADCLQNSKQRRSAGNATDGKARRMNQYCRL